MTGVFRASLFDAQPRLTVAVAGANGLLGSALCAQLSSDGHHVLRLLRHDPAPSWRHDADVVLWDPQAGRLDAAALEGVDAVVNLAGANIGAGRWTAQRMRELLASRVDATRLLAETIAYLRTPPRVYISMSGVGYYGNRGDELLTEASSAGHGFLTELCQAWEAAAQPALAAGVRLVILRSGVVLTARGGALPRMLLPFRLGLGGPIGGGRQHLSWIALHDLLDGFRHALCDESLSGPVNAVSPQLVTNRQFTHTLGEVLGRPAVMPLPALAVRAMFGEMGVETLLYSQRAMPQALLDRGFRFEYADLAAALRHELGL